jgi:hypothetical protein
MDNTVYVHIGPVKTGSTAIQRFLSSNDELLAQMGIHYLKSLRWDRDSSHSPLFWILFNRHGKKYFNDDSVPFVRNQDVYIKEFLDERDRLSDKAIMVSSEILPWIGGDAVDEFLSFFSNRPVKIIHYVRDFREQAKSFVTQIIRLQERRSIDDRISSIHELHVSHLYQYQVNLLQHLKKRVGNTNFIFRKYGIKNFKDGSIYSDILDAMGLSINDGFKVPTAHQFISLKYCETVYFKDFLNRLTLDIPQEKIEKQLLSWEKTHAGTAFYFPARIAEKVERDASMFHKTLLEDFPDCGNFPLFTGQSQEFVEEEYKLPHRVFEQLVDHMEKDIPGFKDHVMERMGHALDRTYDFELRLREFEDKFGTFLSSKKACALWGCGDASRGLLGRHKFLRDTPFFALDKDTGKHGQDMFGRTIMAPDIIEKENIDVVMVASDQYYEQIREEIRNKYRCVRYMINLAQLTFEEIRETGPA